MGPKPRKEWLFWTGRLTKWKRTRRHYLKVSNCCESRLRRLLLENLLASGNMLVRTEIGKNVKDSLPMAFFVAFPFVQSVNCHFYFIYFLISFKNLMGNTAKFPITIRPITSLNSEKNLNGPTRNINSRNTRLFLMFPSFKIKN